MIGSEDLANLIADATIIEDEWDDVDVEHSLIPDGFTYIGSGGYRHAFLGPDGFVYKVNIKGGMGEWGNNSHVFDNYMGIFNAFGNGIRIAECDYFTDSNVMVQEYVDGEKATSWSQVSEVQALVGQMVNVFIDINVGNFRFVGDEVVLIDW